MQPTAHRIRALRSQGTLAVLRHVHEHPGTTRADAARTLGLSSGSATEISARLKSLGLIVEAPAAHTGGRGRPSPILMAHPAGPLVCAVDIGHESWRVAVLELGGRIVGQVTGRHADRAAGRVLGVLRERVSAVAHEYGARLRAVSVIVSGTVQGTRVVQSATLGWRDVDLEPLGAGPGVLLTAGNDASLTGLAEARRGAGTGMKVVLHLTVEVGLGGVLVVDGRLMDGATGAGGEFGHMPFGDPGRECPCGARGCWDQDVDGRGMARALGRPEPRDARTFADEILHAAVTDPAARAAVATVTSALGRGIGALVNALDPDVVTLSGLACGLAETAPRELRDAYLAGLMSFRRPAPPPLRPSMLRVDGPVIGAADVAFDALLTDEGLAAWAEAG